MVREDLLQIDLRKKIKHFIMTYKIEEAKLLLQQNFSDLWNQNKIIQCSLVSI